MPEPEWIFGYGSLIWRADFPYTERRPAFIRDWNRKFWQGSTDHRGVPGAPGRVVTLVSAPGENCWGMAYRLDPSERSEVLAHLDYREKGGYDRLHIDLNFGSGDYVAGMTYHATEDNPNFLGDAASTDIARQVHASVGPSGPNIEYVLQLERALAEIDAVDQHVIDIAQHLRQLMR